MARLLGRRGQHALFAPRSDQRENVKNLQVAWTWRFDNYGTPAETVTTETTPLMVNGVLYFTAGQRRNRHRRQRRHRRDAVDVAAGRGRAVRRGAAQGAPRRGLLDRRQATSGSSSSRPGFQLVALERQDRRSRSPASARTASSICSSSSISTCPLDPDRQDRQQLTAGRSPTTSSSSVRRSTPGGRVNKANVKGDVMAFDVRTGKKLWTFHTIPRKGEPGYETWLNGSAEYTGNAGVWGPFSADPQLGYVYLHIESATNDVYGGHRPGNNLFSDSLVCLDIKTGKMIWHQQLVHHDIWDYDMPPHPILIDINVDGKPVQAVVQLTKQAFAYVFDRTNGTAGVAGSRSRCRRPTCRGEWTAPTQPFPTKPPAFDQQGITANDLIDFTPELRAEAIKAIEGYRLGPIYTPAHAGRAERQQGHDRRAGPRRRRELARRRGGSGDRLRLRRLGNDSRRDRPDPEHRSDDDRRRHRLHVRAARCPTIQGLRAAEAAVRAHHRLQHEQGRDRLADPERRHAAGGQEQPGAEGTHDSRRPAAHRRPGCW